MCHLSEKQKNRDINSLTFVNVGGKTNSSLIFFYVFYFLRNNVYNKKRQKPLSACQVQQEDQLDIFTRCFF